MGHVSSKTWSPGQILENYFLNITSDLDPQVSPVVYKAMKKGNFLKSSLSGERSRALWALLFFLGHELGETLYSLMPPYNQNANMS